MKLNESDNKSSGSVNVSVNDRVHTCDADDNKCHIEGQLTACVVKNGFNSHYYQNVPLGFILPPLWRHQK